MRLITVIAKQSSVLNALLLKRFQQPFLRRRREPFRGGLATASLLLTLLRKGIACALTQLGRARVFVIASIAKQSSVLNALLLKRSRPLAFVVFFMTGIAFASGGAQGIRLEHVKINLNDKASILRGAKFFAQNCMVCHTMKYLGYNKIAKEAGITLDKMPLKNKEWWLGVTPPDLTLIARIKSPDWLFTYFHAFYKDSSRPTGYNNLLMKDVNMTNVLATYQGQQELTVRGKVFLEHPGNKKVFYYNILEMVKAGSMSPQEYNQTMTDLVNFLVYAGDPHRAEREHIGIWVLIFLGFMIVLTYFLKKSFWKDVD